MTYDSKMWKIAMIKIKNEWADVSTLLTGSKS